MTQREWTVWLPSALMLLWLPGCVTQSYPKTVTGPEGGSLAVQCLYKEEYKENDKFWCKGSYGLTCEKIVETRVSGTKEKGRVSIKDNPDQLSFTVTMWNLTVGDEGTYQCGINIKWVDQPLNPIDQSFPVVVSVTRATPTSKTPGHVTLTTTSTTTTEGPLVSPTTLATEDVTNSVSSQNFNQNQGPGLHVLFSMVAILLFLLMGASLVAWRLTRRRLKAAETAKPFHSLSQSQPQPTQSSEPCYANLHLQTLHSGQTPQQQQDAEVVYSAVASSKEELHYTSVTFTPQNQDSEATSILSKSPREESEYSVVKKR